LLAKVTWAKTSDFKLTGTNEKTRERLVQDALRVYDRVTAANLAILLSSARVEWPKGVLDLTSKLVKFSEKAMVI
jgi:hypothetical protein